MSFEELRVGVNAIDNNNFVLIILLSLAASYILNELLKPVFWVMLLAIPVMLASASCSVAYIRMQGWFFTTDEGVNTIIGATAGLTVSFIFCAAIYRAMCEMRDDSRSGAYRSKYKLPSKPSS